MFKWFNCNYMAFSVLNGRSLCSSPPNSSSLSNPSENKNAICWRVFSPFSWASSFFIFQPLLECHDVAVSFGENEKSKYPEENMIGGGEIWIMLNEHVTYFGTWTSVSGNNRKAIPLKHDSARHSEKGCPKLGQCRPAASAQRACHECV